MYGMRRCQREPRWATSKPVLKIEKCCEDRFVGASEDVAGDVNAMMDTVPIGGEIGGVGN